MTSSQLEFADAARQLGWTVFSAGELKADPQPLLRLLPLREEQ
jgi:hypothetical protein